jgi:hypothetical protein
MAEVSPDELRARANELFRARHPRAAAGSPGGRHGLLIAEFPFAPGQVMRVELFEAKGSRDDRPRANLSFRAWIIEPGGTRFPSRAGFSMSMDVVPQLATAIARAMERQLDALDWAADEEGRR